MATVNVEIGIPTAVDMAAIPTSKRLHQPEVHPDMERLQLPEQVRAQRITVRTMLSITVLIHTLLMVAMRIMSPTTSTTSRWPNNSSKRKNRQLHLHLQHPVKLLHPLLELERLELDLLPLLRLGVDTVL